MINAGQVSGGNAPSVTFCSCVWDQLSQADLQRLSWEQHVHIWKACVQHLMQANLSTRAARAQSRTVGALHRNVQCSCALLIVEVSCWRCSSTCRSALVTVLDCLIAL